MYITVVYVYHYINYYTTGTVLVLFILIANFYK